MSTRLRFTARRSQALRATALAGALALLAACSLLPGPDPTPAPTALVPPPTEFAPLAADATAGLGTGANDFVNGLAASGDTVVAAGTVYGNRLAPTFRYSTDAGASWQLGRLSQAAAEATPPDQGDQTDDVAVTTVDGATRWVILGHSWRQPLTWTSADGRTWDRQVTPADQIAENASVRDIAATPQGFVLVGTDAKDVPTAWTSTDGATWRAHPMGGAGSPAAVAAKGGTVVAVGSREDAYATWVSTDRGRTWKRGAKPAAPRDDSGFQRSLDDVTATEDGFAAIGSYFAEEWRPVTYTSTNGRSWRPSAGGAALAPVPSSEGTLIRSADGQDLLVTQEREPQSQPRLWTRQGGVWRPATTPLNDRSRLVEGDWSVGAVDRAGDAWIVSALLSRNGQIVAELWRSTDGGRTFAAVPRPDAELNQPVAYPAWVVRTGEETLVFGDSRRRPVVWSRTGTAAFGPARLASDQASDRIDGAAAGPRGALAYGNRSVDDNNFAVVWRRQGNRWVPTAPGTFSAADRRYASSSIAQIAWLRNRWVAVGSTSDNGDLNDSALVATSTDGRTWTKGRAARTFAAAGGDVWYDVTDLQGDHDRKRAINGVTVVGSRLLAVGDSAEGEASEGNGTAATVWTSDDARTWTMRRLPLGGLSWSSMDRLAVRGATVVVVGSGAVSEGAPTQLVSWRSADGGRTWTQRLLDPTLETDDGATILIALRTGFALIAATVDGTSRPVLLLSDDGATWRNQPASAVTRGPGEGAGVASAVASGDDLWLLGRTVNRAGSGSRLVVQPTR